MQIHALWAYLIIGKGSKISPFLPFVYPRGELWHTIRIVAERTYFYTIFLCLRRREFDTTETELVAMATDAKIGLSKI